MTTPTPHPTPSPPADTVLVAGPPRLRSRWYMTLPLLIAVSTLAIVAWQRPPDGIEHGEDIYRFVGRFHPSLTHFPIGLLILMPILDLLGVLRRSRHFWSAGQLVLWLATLGIIVSGTAGYLLARFDGHGGQDTIDHQWAGIATAAWCCFALLFRSLARGGTRRVVWGFFYVISLAFALVGLVFAGHRGGKLTYGDDYLIKYAPPTIKSFMQRLEGETGDAAEKVVPAATPPATPPEEPGTPASMPATPTTHPISTTEPTAALPPPTDRTVFAAVVQPIFLRNCVECHGAKKVKGGLRLDSFAAAMEGGENGSTIVPGSVADSELARLIQLPANDQDVMPPPKKPRLTSDEIDAITRWIAQGASET